MQELAELAQTLGSQSTLLDAEQSARLAGWIGCFDGRSLAIEDRTYQQLGSSLNSDPGRAELRKQLVGKDGQVILAAANTRSVQNSADLDATYHDYYSGQQVLETRNGSDQTLKQWVWGLTYVDELIQVSLNNDPDDGSERECESSYWALVDANYNVIGLLDSTGALQERYEYSPYGQRTVYTRAGSNDPACRSPMQISKRWVTSTAPTAVQPYGLCEAGHQGLRHDEESGLVYNRARMLHAGLGRFVQRDPQRQNMPGGGYHDGMNLYQYCGSKPVRRLDPSGLDFIALGSRNLDTWWPVVSDYQHSKVEYWESRCNPKDGEQVTVAELIDPAGKYQARRIGSVEIHVDDNWRAYRLKVWVSNWQLVEGFVMEDVKLSVVVFDAGPPSTTVRVVYGNGLIRPQVKQRWNEIGPKAKQYPYAEQPGQPVQNWPNSYYGGFDNNCHTFTRWLLDQFNLPWPGVPGPTAPGNLTPQNVTGTYSQPWPKNQPAPDPPPLP